MPASLRLAAVLLVGLLGALPVSAQYLRTEATVPRMNLAEFKKLLANDGVYVIDVRGDEAYRAGHIPGALSIPLDKIAERAAELKTVNKPIVTYCTWQNEQTSAGAALTLQRLGVTNVSALLGGFGAWVAGQNPVVPGDKPR